MVVSPFQRKIVYPHLRGIEDLTEQPYAIPDIAAARVFHADLENSTLDTSSCILWKKGGIFKVTNNFPWQEIVPKYLGDSHLGKKSVIEILPDTFAATEEEEFQLINPSDDPQEVYALSTKHTFLRSDFTKEELKLLNAGRIGEGLERQEAYVHPIWAAIMNKNDLEHRFVVDWIWQNRHDHEKLMGIYLEDPQKLCAITLKYRGRINDGNILGTTGFNCEKRFLTTS